MTEASPATAGSEGAPGGDPSMEDILASIRRILNEETAVEGASPAEGAPAVEEAPLLLDQTMLSKSPGIPQTAPEPAASAPPMPPQLIPMAAAPQPATTAEADVSGLLAPQTEQAASGAMAALAAQIIAGRDLATHRGGPTIEDLVRQEIRPLLKSWLDAYLPPMVERLVQTELERLGNRLGH